MSSNSGLVTSIAAAVLAIGVFAYIGFTLSQKDRIQSWGKRILVLGAFGLLLCILVAYRDGYHLSVQAAMDGSVLPGRFTLDSMQSTVASIGGGLIAFSAVSAFFVKKQAYRRNMFLLLSAAILFKTLVIELSRVLF
ncbi:MAG TPA: hypothetical protein VLN47_01460 [Clostridiaceae bacterium]|nr:hypothetical protein [Clostridiaceae bacterium]